MLILVISRPRCLSKAHRTQPPRTPDARSCKVSERERAGAFPPRSCEGGGSRDRASGEAGMVGCGALRKTMGFPEKMRMAPCRASIRLPFPTSPGKPGAPRHARRVGTRWLRVVSSPRFRRCAACKQIHHEPKKNRSYAHASPRKARGYRGTENSQRYRGKVGCPLYLWLFSVPLHSRCCFPGFGMIMMPEPAKSGFHFTRSNEATEKKRCRRSSVALLLRVTILFPDSV